VFSYLTLDKKTAPTCPRWRAASVKSKSVLLVLGATLCLTAWAVISICAQEMIPRLDAKVDATATPFKTSGEVQVGEDAEKNIQLARAQDAISKKDEYIAALERRVKQLEEELASCKGETRKP
jgi:hypothetical protein